jgi:hypothetical protein
MNQEGMLKPVLTGGVLLGILSALPFISMFNCFCCAWVIGGGMLAAHLYISGSPVAVTLGRGVILGLFSGIIGAVVDTLLSIPLHLLLVRMGVGFVEQIRQALEQIPNLPAETRSTLESVMSGNGNIGIVFLILAGFLKIVIYGIVAMLGGALGVAIFEKRKLDSGFGGGQQPPQPPINIPPSPPSEPPTGA